MRLAYSDSIARSLCQVVWYFGTTVYFNHTLTGKQSERVLLATCSLCSFVFLALAFISFKLIPLSDSSAIIFSSPLYVNLFAHFILGESCGLLNIMTVVCSLIGVVLISRPTFLFDPQASYTLDRTGLVCAILASMASALYYIVMRKLKKTPISVISFWYSMVNGILCLVILIPLHTFVIPKGWQEYTWLTLNAVCGIVGSFLLNLAFKLDEAGPVTLARSMDIVMAFVYQVVWLNKPVSLNSVLGAIIIISSVAILSLKKTKDKKSSSNKLTSDKVTNGSLAIISSPKSKLTFECPVVLKVPQT